MLKKTVYILTAKELREAVRGYAAKQHSLIVGQESEIKVNAEREVVIEAKART